MINSDQTLHPSTDILPQDLKLIEYFILGKRKLINGSNLRIEYGAKAIKLIDKQNRVVGVSKQVNEWQQKILLYRHSTYSTTIQDRMNHSDFLSIARTGHPDFAEYHKYQIPRGYQLFYQPAHLLLKSWQERHAQSVGYQPNGLMIYQGNNWYPVQDVDTYKEIILLRTIISELTIGSKDFMVWINRLPSTAAIPPSSDISTKIPTSQRSGYLNAAPLASAPLPPPTTPMSIPNTTGDSKTSGESTKSELTAVFKTPVVTAINPPAPAPEEVLTNLKNAIKLKALARLVDYLNDGEQIVNTEVVKNNTGQVVSTKVTEIKRGCPRWVIEQVKKF
jgi:hypothetical protein